MATDAPPQTPWGHGDYHRFATATVWQVGPELIAAGGVRPGQHLLDVAAGSGNVALRAAQAGAAVVAVDLEPSSLAAGRREAERLGVAVEWVVADAQALPFADADFDVVASCFGAIFAPDHEAVAGELLRVCRPGGSIVMANFTPDGLAAEFFGLFARHAPPPPGGRAPTQWGSEPYLRELFGQGVSALQASRRELVERLDGTPADYVAFYRQTFGPAAALYEHLAPEPDRLAALDRDFHAFAEQANRGPDGGPVEYAYPYLLVVARRSG